METVYVGNGPVQDGGQLVQLIYAVGPLRFCGYAELGDSLLEWVREWSGRPVDAAGRERLQALTAEVEADGPQLRACRTKLLGLL